MIVCWLTDIALYLKFLNVFGCYNWILWTESKTSSNIYVISSGWFLWLDVCYLFYKLFLKIFIGPLLFLQISVEHILCTKHWVSHHAPKDIIVWRGVKSLSRHLKCNVKGRYRDHRKRQFTSFWKAKEELFPKRRTFKAVLEDKSS